MIVYGAFEQVTAKQFRQNGEKREKERKREKDSHKRTPWIRHCLRNATLVANRRQLDACIRTVTSVQELLNYTCVN